MGKGVAKGGAKDGGRVEGWMVMMSVFFVCVGNFAGGLEANFDLHC